ncbi:uncharacterized protein [Scyliorhinus torazame]
MSEGWEDCPVLPVGWKRREVYRRSGATIGKSDTYYMSPTAERFRSKVELVKYFGDSLDLTYFDFKKGLILPPTTKIRKAVKRLSTTSCDGDEQDWQPTPKKKVKVTISHSPIEVKMEKDSTTESLASDPLDTLIVCCEDCQQWVPGVMFGARKRRFKFYCAECRARRRELGRKLNYYKRFGCGECGGCAVMEDCGICRGCMVRNTNPTKNWKCVKRRCQKLKEIKTEASYRVMVGKPKKEIKTEASYRDTVGKPKKEIKTEASDRVTVGKPKKEIKAEASDRDTVGKPKKEIKAEASYRDTVGKPKKKMKVPFQALKKAMKKVKSESQVEKKFPKKIKTQPIIKAEVIAQEKPCPPIEEEEIQEPPIQLFAPVPIYVSEDFIHYYNVNSEFLLKNSRSRRNNRSCGECEACLRPVDCGACDFCMDKAKFGGCNTLRQKCRWKQCLQFASKRLLPRELLGGQSPWPDWKEQGYRSGRRRWKENAFASRKVARVIQAARKRKIWQVSAQSPEVETMGAEPAEQTDPTRVEMPEGAESSQAGAHSPHSSLHTAEQKVISVPPDGSAKGDGSTHRSPGIKARTQAKAFNLNNFLSVMKPFLKPPSSSKGHERPSVIKETNSEQTRSQPLEAAAVRSQATPSVAKRDTSRSDSERIPIARSVSETESTSHRSASPSIKQRDSRERHGSRKTAPTSSEEAGVQDLSIRVVSPMIREGDAEPASTARPPVSPKRPAEPEVRTSGVPSNSRIVRGATPEQTPGYGRSTPTAGEAGQSVAQPSLEESNPGDDSSLPVERQKVREEKVREAGRE